MASANDKNNIKDYLETTKWAGYSLRDILIKLSFFLVPIIIIPLLFPSGRSLKYTDLAIGSIVNKKVIAPFSFPVLKTDEQLARDRAEAAGKIPNYFDYNENIAFEQISNFDGFIKFIGDLPRDINLLDTLTTSRVQTINFGNDSLFDHIFSKYKPNLTKEEIIQFAKGFDKLQNSPITNTLHRILMKIYEHKVIDISKAENPLNKIGIFNKGVEEEINLDEVYDLVDAQLQFTNSLGTNNKNAQLRKIAVSFVKPNLIFNRQVTEKRKNDAIALVSLALDLVYENERIIDANERVTDEIYQKLRSLEVALAEKSALEGNIQNFLFHFGKYLLTLLILFLLAMYLYKNWPTIFNDNTTLFLISLIIFLQVALGAVIVGPLDWSPYLIPTTISCMLLGILFDVSIGIFGTVVVGLLMGGILGLDYSITTMIVITGFVATYSVSRIRTRNQIFKAVLYISLAYTASLIAFNTLRYEEISETFKAFIYFILPNAILSPFITYMSLGVFERGFDITTDVTLLELSDLNHPLLKKLANQAPGTFHHSVVVGNLAEAAAKQIKGANSLLARVGSYYHDIGKMTKPEYFVENQKGGENRHNSLAPNMSALILSAHVKNGLELAEEYKLPKRISSFIPEHHGRNVMTYFYNKALETKGESEINIENYRYPGPKPKTKETAIVMLADTVEAASKTLKNPTPDKLRKLVNDLVEKRFLEGELEDCNLSMRDLKSIVDGFVSVLIGIYHERIVYPVSEKSKTSNRKK